MKVRTHDNATHLLECAHCIGSIRNDYHMRCHLLDTTKSGNAKVQVFGSRNWKGGSEHSYIRYVSPGRVSLRRKNES